VDLGGTGDQRDHATPEYEIDGRNKQKPAQATLTAVLACAIRNAANHMTHGFLQSSLLELESDETPVLGHAQASLIGCPRACPFLAEWPETDKQASFKHLEREECRKRRPLSAVGSKTISKM
jgi:hypothetical protein